MTVQLRRHVWQLWRCISETYCKNSRWGQSVSRYHSVCVCVRACVCVRVQWVLRRADERIVTCWRRRQSNSVATDPSPSSWSQVHPVLTPTDAFRSHGDRRACWSRTCMNTAALSTGNNNNNNNNNRTNRLGWHKPKLRGHFTNVTKIHAVASVREASWEKLSLEPMLECR